MGYSTSPSQFFVGLLLLKTMHRGFIKLHRRFLDWEWGQRSEMVHLFIHFLLLANHKENKWQGQVIREGQFITGLHSLSEQTGISVQTIRTCITRLKSTSEITVKSTNRFRLITLIKWGEYQGITEKSTSKSTSRLTNNQQSTNNQLTTNKNDKNDKNDKNKKEDSFKKEDKEKINKKLKLDEMRSSLNKKLGWVK